MVQVTRFAKFEAAKSQMSQESNIVKSLALLLRGIAEEIELNKKDRTELEAFAVLLTNSSSEYATALLAKTDQPQPAAQPESRTVAMGVVVAQDDALEREKQAEEEAAKQANETTRQTRARHKAENAAKDE